jgi:GLPGLI family protein
MVQKNGNGHMYPPNNYVKKDNYKHQKGGIPPFFKIFTNMKHFFYITMLLSFLISNAQQSAKVIYKVVKKENPQRKQEIINKQGEEFYLNMAKISNKSYSIAKDFNFILLFNPNESLYFWEEEMPDETVSRIHFILARNMGSGMSIKYQNKKENLLMTQGPNPGSTKIYREVSKLDKYKWTITQETDSIMGYPVIKAVGHNMEVWFAPDIPVPFGPAGLGGLPGLILKKHIPKQSPAYDIVATEIRFYKKPIKIKRPKKGILITEKEAKAQRMQQIFK